MAKLPRISSRELLTALRRVGFYVHHQTGSHINLRHYEKKHLHVVVPAKRKTLAPKTLQSILVQAELSVEELRGWL